MPKEFVFFTYLLESYAQSRHTRAADVLAALDAQGRTEFVYDMYEMYHSEAIEALLTTSPPLYKPLRGQTRRYRPIFPTAASHSLT